MISPQELRIGNFIYKDHPIEFGEYEVITVQAEDESHFRINRNPDGYYPIPLTEDILLKCGAKKIDEKLYKFEHAFLVHEAASGKSSERCPLVPNLN